jgi:hypothetical protein
VFSRPIFKCRHAFIHEASPFVRLSAPRSDGLANQSRSDTYSPERYGGICIDRRGLERLWFLGGMLLGTIALAGLIIAVALLMLAAQRHIANKRLANERRNKDED